jgi:hypothetical protein
MTDVVATGRIELVDANDSKQLQMFISSSQPKTQIYSKDSNQYLPDWAASKPVLTPQLYIAGTSVDVINNAKSIKWFEDNRSSQIVNNSNYTLGAGSKTLTINDNIMGDSHLRFDGVDDHMFLLNVVSMKSMEIDLKILGSMEEGDYVVDFRSALSAYIWNGSGSIVGLAATVDGSPVTAMTDIPIGKRVKLKITLSTSSYTGDVAILTRNNVDGRFLDAEIHSIKVYNASNSLVSTFDQDNRSGANIVGATWNLNPSTKVISCEAVYTDPDTGFDVLAKSSIEFEKVESGTKGDKGSTGANAVMAILSNDFHLIPTDSAGNNGSYSGSATTMTIYSGATDDSSKWTVSAAASSGVTGTLSGKTYTVTNMTTDTGYVDLTASRSGYTSIKKRFNLAKSKQGSEGDKGNTGSDSYIHWLVADAAVIKKDLSGNYTPSSIKISAQKNTGTSIQEDYPARYIIAESTDGITYTDKYTSNGNEYERIFTPSAGIKSVRVRMYASGGLTILLDEQEIPVVEDGATGLTGDNSNSMVAWAPDGNIIKNGEGNITGQADMYDGTDIVEAEDYRWYRQNPESSAGDYANEYIKQVYDSTFEKGISMWSESYSGKTVPPIDKHTTTVVDGKSVMRIVGDEWLFSVNPIPVDVTKTYEMTFRVKQEVAPTSGGSLVYAGVATLDENYQNITGGAGSHRYFCISSKTIAVEDGWLEFTDTITGVGDTSHDNFREGTKYVRPMFIVNYTGGNGTVLVDEITFKEVESENSAKGWESLDVPSGRNLLEGSADIKKSWESDGYGSYHYLLRANIASVFPKVKVGDKLTFSFDVDMERGDTIRVYDSNEDMGLVFGGHTFTNIGGSKQRLSFTATLKESTKTPRTNWLLDFYNSDNGDKFSISNIKIEKGEKEDPLWSEAPEDIVITPEDTNMYGRNLLIDSTGNRTRNGEYHWHQNSRSQILPPEPDKPNSSIIQFSSTATSNIWLMNWNRNAISLEGLIGRKIRVSFDFRVVTPPTASGGSIVTARTYDNPDDVGSGVDGLKVTRDAPFSAYTAPVGEWQRISYSFTPTNPEEKYLRISPYMIQDGVWQWREIKVEVDYESDYSPAPEDNESFSPALNGEDSWIFEKYENTTGQENYVDENLISYDLLKSIIPSSKTVIPDGSELVSDIAESYIGYLRTAVYTSSAKEISFNFHHYNAVKIFVNSVAVFSKEIFGSSTATLKLKSGWNEIEFVYLEEIGSDGILHISPTISSQVEEMNCHYALPYGRLRGRDGIEGYNTKNITIPATAITNVEGFKCLVVYQSKVYEDVIVVNDVTDPYSIVILGTSTFKNGQGQSTFTAKLFQNGIEVDADDSKGFIYKWYIYNADDSVHDTWDGVGYKVGKSITVNASDIMNEGRLVCEVDA